MAVEDNPDLWTDLGGTLAANGAKHYSLKKKKKEGKINKVPKRKEIKKISRK